MTEFTIQAETLRSTAKNLRLVAARYQEEAQANTIHADEIMYKAKQQAEPYFTKFSELVALAEEQTKLAEKYESAANILSMR